MAMVNIVHHTREEQWIEDFDGGGETWIGDIWELKWRHERCNSIWWGEGEGGRHNHHVFVVSHLFSVGSIHVCVCVNIGVSVLKIGTEFSGDYNSYQTQSCVLLVKRDCLCSFTTPRVFTLHGSRCWDFYCLVLFSFFVFPVSYKLSGIIRTKRERTTPIFAIHKVLNWNVCLAIEGLVTFNATFLVREYIDVS